MRQRLEGEAAASCKFTDDILLRSPLQILRFIQETHMSQYNNLRNITIRSVRAAVKYPSLSVGRLCYPWGMSRS